MNHVALIGRITSIPRNEPHETQLHYLVAHVHVPAEDQGSGVWVTVFCAGHHAREIGAELQPGDNVTVLGRLVAASNPIAGPVHVRAKRIFIHGIEASE